MTIQDQFQATERPLFSVPRKSHLLYGTALFLAVFAFGALGVVPLAPDAADLPVTMLSQDLPAPALGDQIDRLAKQEQHYIREEKIRTGDSLASLLNRLGVNDEAAVEFIKKDKTAHSLMQLRRDKRVQAEISTDGELRWLRTTLADNKSNKNDANNDANNDDRKDSNLIRNLLIARQDGHFTAKEETAKLERRIEMHTGDIKTSLFAATDAAKLPENVTQQLIDMFNTNIDFMYDLRRGDHFNIVYETFWQDGEFIRAGRVLAGEFVNGKNVYQSVWFDEPGGEQGGGYFSFDGKSLKKAFLKSPLEFSRISSGFSMRMHPISGQWKQHTGVDFAAATGTPIRASGDGTVAFVGGKSGYGNLVEIKHWANYTTAYAHMSRFANGIRTGSKVKQGDLIGYVGSTGWATGPHLHYEFRLNNQAQDPMKMKIPTQQPLTGTELARFRQVAGEISHRFALLRPEQALTQLAQLPKTTTARP